MFSKLLLPLRHSRTFTTKKLTVDPYEIENFGKMAKEWWDQDGILAPLHSLNLCRIPWISDRLHAVGVIKSQIDKAAPMKGLSVLDVGCGGGILIENLSRLGCDATGLDANEELINIAKCHAKTQNSNLKYIAETIEEHVENHRESYDVIVSSEVIEHVTEKDDFIKYTVQCLKPGGSLFITTPNRTLLSWLCVIIISEDLLKILPKGTHRYPMFIHRDDLVKILRKENCETVHTSGLVYNPLKNYWTLIKTEKICYVLHAIKRT